MSQPNKNKDAQVDQRNPQCLLFEQQLHAHLDGRDSMSALASDPHLDSCAHCRISFDIYRQFDGAGGAVLNGGARTLPSNRKDRSPDSQRRWLPLSSLAMAVAAALIIYAVASPPGGESNNQFAAVAVSSDLDVENSSAVEVSSLESENDTAPKQGNSNYVVALRPATGYPQPTVEPLSAVGTISQRMLSSSFVSTIAGKPGSGWDKPWQYTSELPGIRPFHQSVSVALVLYNDSMTVL